MWHRLLVPFLAVGSLLHPHHQSDPYTQMVEKAEKSVVRVTGEMTRETMFGTQQGTYTCTGEVIAPDRVLTAAHCVGQKMKTDQDDIQVVIKADKTLDLAILATNTHQKPSMKFRTSPVVRCEVLTAIRYAYGATGCGVYRTSTPCSRIYSYAQNGESYSREESRRLALCKASLRNSHA